MIERFDEMIGKLGHCGIYAGLCGTHIWAAIMTGKPEVYLPIALFYALATRC